jgi:hypothetical protein
MHDLKYSQCSVLLQEYLLGIAGMVIALVLETVLFVSRDAQAVGAGKKYEALLDPSRHAMRQQKPKPAEGIFQTSPVCHSKQDGSRQKIEAKKQR